MTSLRASIHSSVRIIESDLIRLRWVYSVCCPASHTMRTATTSRVGVAYSAARGCKLRDVIGENQHQVRYASER